MFLDLRPYSEMKDSGLPWLGRIPSHWETLRAKFLFREADERSETGSETHLSMSQKYGLVESSKVEQLPLQSESYAGGKLCKRNDLVLNRLKAHLGVFACAPQDGVVSPDYTVLRLIRDGQVRYYECLFKTPEYIGELRRNTRGIVEGFWRLYTDDFYNIRVVVPPPLEQQSIVRFLDYFERNVLLFVRAKQKASELLNEQKRAIIHRAVTRGLNVNVNFKPSHVEWLGDVPEHWDVRRLKFVAQIKTGGRDTVDRKDGGAYPFFVRSQTVEKIDTYSFDGEAVLTAGDGAGVAKVFHYVNGKFDYHQRVYKFSNFKNLRGRFFYFYLSSTLRFEAFRETAKSTVDSLRLPMLQNLPILLPPLPEQDRIIAWIDHETHSLEESLSSITREIELLHEYRARLIADVVTGKLDIRQTRVPATVESYKPLPYEENGVGVADEPDEVDSAVGIENASN